MHYYQMFPERGSSGEVSTPADSLRNAVNLGRPSRFADQLASEMLFDKKHTAAFDLIPCTTDVLILSSEAATVIRQFKLQDSVRFEPVRILTRRGDEVRRCVCMLFFETLKLLDMERSAFTYGRTNATKDIPLGLTDGVLRSDLLPPADLVYAQYADYVASAALVNAIRDAKLKNFAFKELPVS